ncbi:MAG: PIN domain-containing protein [Verrucomicrobiales bacterium]|nr:PIN domain-containing protein [Verrucomicrobiales bacterium]
MKVLVDTSVWIDHLRRGDPLLVELLTAGHIVVHSAVIGELACGTLRERDRVLRDLQRLPGLPEPRPEEALHLVGCYQLWGRGLGWMDILLLASCRLGNAILWTRDRALNAAAAELGLAYSPPRAG